MKTKTPKKFDAVEESRKWKAIAAKKLSGFKTAKEMRAFLDKELLEHHRELGIDRTLISGD